MIGLIAVPFVALWIGALFAALGLLLAPAFALLCRRAAQRNGLDARRYAIMGGVHSCIILYSYWALGPISLVLLLDFAGGGSVLWIGLLVIWVASAVRAANRSQEAQVVPLPIASYAYIIPFALAYLSSAVSIVSAVTGWAE